MKLFDQRYETMAQPERAQFQLERLQALLVRLKRNVRRQREALGDCQIQSLEDISKLPFTTPEDFSQGFPYGMFALPLREVIRLCSLTGPQGAPLVAGHTRNDLTQWGRLVARQLVACGVTASDVIQLCLGGASPSASGYQLGAEVVEASVIGEDPSHVDYQLAMLQNYRPTILVATPVHALELIGLIEQRRIDPQSLHLRSVLLSRPVDAEWRERIRAGLFAPVQCNFGVEEILDPGFCVECEAGHFHANEDQFLVEIVDGELVVTTLCREAMPLLRYRTRIACEAIPGKCACGRTGMMLAPGGRLDQRLRVNETPLYESQIAAVLAQSRASGHPFRLEVFDRHVAVAIQMSEPLFSDTIWPLERLRYELEADFAARLGVQVKVRFYGAVRA